ncbi:AP4AT protein, partial [Urocolius indicus]|nr:AP4AT protein [Urocolius indicus]
MAAPLRDRLSFLSRLPLLLRGTADDDEPCPGYLFEEIAKISHESPGSSQCLLEYLLSRLQSSSCPGTLKVLKILQHTCTQGSPQFVLQLRRNGCFIREAAAFSGPPDPLHGNSLNQKVRAAAQDLASVLFSDVPLPQPAVPAARPLPPAGMGSSPSPCSSLQGFGFSGEKSSSASTGEALLSTIQRAAEAVAQAVLPSPEGPRPCPGGLREDSYEPVRAPSPAPSPPGAGKPPAPSAARGPRARHQPGLAGGGWEEVDSGHSSRGSSQGNGDLSCGRSGSDGHSGAGRELPQAPDSRVDADSPGDCVREVSLVAALTRGARVFLTREEAQTFVKDSREWSLRAENGPGAGGCHSPSPGGEAEPWEGTLGLLPGAVSLPERRCWDQPPFPAAPPSLTLCPLPQILRQFEALCRDHPSETDTGPGCDTPVLPVGSAPCPGDLLTDVPLPAGDGILSPLSPLSSAPQPPAPAHECGVEAECHGQPGTAVPACHCEQEGVGRLAGGTAGTPALSLFAGMELVARPGAGLCPDPRPPEPQPQPRDAQMDAEGGWQPSAFAFLNL